MARCGGICTLKIKLNFLLLLLCTNILLSSSSNNSSFELSIIHFSDFHTRFLPITLAAGVCHVGDECVGGIARVATMVEHLKQTRPNAILLNAGDFFQGTLFYEVFRGNATAHFINKLHHDVITIGNHDFDDGITGLAKFVKSVKAPAVLANVDCSDEPLLQNLLRSSVIVKKGDKDIGVIGVITSDSVKSSSRVGKIKFLDEVETVNSEAKKLKAQGVQVIIVLSHCGIELDKIIARSCPDVDVVVGGHSHVLLYSGKIPSNEVAYDEYPIVVTQESGRKVLIVHSGPFTKYMGDIKVTFDHKHEVVNWEGKPIYLDKSVAEDPSTLRELEPWKVEADRVGKQVVGETLVFLNGSCSKDQCSMANLITDAMVDKYSTVASVSLTLSFLVQNSIPTGEILYEDLYGAVPYNKTWDLVELKGSDLLELIKINVVSNPGEKTIIGRVLIHWSGIKVVYDLSKSGSDVASVQIRCNECSDKRFKRLKLNKWYKVVVINTLLTPQFGLAEKFRNRVVGESRDFKNMIDYIKKITPVNVTKDSRMVFI